MHAKIYTDLNFYILTRAVTHNISSQLLFFMIMQLSARVYAEMGEGKIFPRNTHNENFQEGKNPLNNTQVGKYTYVCVHLPSDDAYTCGYGIYLPAHGFKMNHSFYKYEAWATIHKTLPLKNMLKLNQ